MMLAKGYPPDHNKLNNYGKYSAMAFQMALIIGLGTYGGLKLDQWLNLDLKIFTMLCALLSVFFAIYFVVKDLIKPK